MLKGSCACGEICYEITGELIGPVSYCHCWRCRKHSGSSFGTTANVRSEELRFTRGESNLRFWESSPGIRRYFAGCCGSPIYKTGEGEHLGFRLGTLDCDPGVKVETHFMIDARAPWVVLDPLPVQTGGEGPFDYLRQP
ncbi:MAG: GFA family protein [Pseudomonadales bacterium]